MCLTNGAKIRALILLDSVYLGLIRHGTCAQQAGTQSNDKPTTEQPDDEFTGKATTANLKVKDLALTKDATEVEYNSLVEHVLFKSKSKVKKVCAELAANFKAQGWTNDGADLVQPQSSILKRKRGDATLPFS